MPSYATIADAKDLYGENYVLTSVDRDKDGQVDLTSFQDALDQGASEIDSYLATRYDVPITPIPNHLIKINIDIAIYNSSPGALARTKEKRQRYEDAIAWLLRASKGLVSVVVAATPEPSNSPELVTSPRIMTRSKLGRIR